MDIICPSCYAGFPSEKAFFYHIDANSTGCITNLERLASQIPAATHEIPVSPAFLCGSQDTNVRGEYHPTSGFISRERGETLLNHLKAYKYERHRMNVPYYPFQDEGEWNLAKFLILNLTKSQTSQFLKLKWVYDLSLSNFQASGSNFASKFENRPAPSFNTVDKLFSWLAGLFQGTQWQFSPITLNDFRMIHPIRLVHCNSLDIIQELLSNLMFARYMYDPHIVMQGVECEYSEIFTGTRAFDIQVCIICYDELHANLCFRCNRITFLLVQLLFPSFSLLTRHQSHVKLVDWRCIQFS